MQVQQMIGYERDPLKPGLMQRYYQRVVCSHGLRERTAGRPDRVQRFNDFYTGTTNPGKAPILI